MKKEKKKNNKLRSKNKDKTVYLILAISIALIAILIGTTKPKEEKWIQKGDILTKGNLVLELGDYYDYDETNDGKEDSINDVEWKVLGIDENGNLMIVSATNVEIHKIGNKDNPEQTKSEYASGYKILDTIAQLYGKGENVIDARSITIEDINKLTGFDIEKARLEDDMINQEITYFWDGTNKPTYKTKNDLTGKLNMMHESFVWYNRDNKTWNSSDRSKTASINNLEIITTGKNTWYSYSNENNGDELLQKGSKKYNMIFNTSNNSPASYWLASNYTIANERYMAFGYFTVIQDSINYSNLVYSNNQVLERELGVRVVITLDV